MHPWMATPPAHSHRAGTHAGGGLLPPPRPPHQTCKQIARERGSERTPLLANTALSAHAMCADAEHDSACSCAAQPSAVQQRAHRMWVPAGVGRPRSSLLPPSRLSPPSSSARSSPLGCNRGKLEWQAGRQLQHCAHVLPRLVLRTATNRRPQPQMQTPDSTHAPCRCTRHPPPRPHPPQTGGGPPPAWLPGGPQPRASAGAGSCRRGGNERGAQAVSA